MSQANTVVVKIGSTLVANSERLTPRFGFIQRLLEDVAKLRAKLRDAGRACVFSEPQFTPRLVNSLTAGLPVESAQLDPLGADTPASADGYVHMLSTLTDNLGGCLESL